MEKETPQPYAFFVAGHAYGVPGTPDLGVYSVWKEKFGLIRQWPGMAFGVLTGDIVKKPSVEAWDAVDHDLDSLGIPTHFAVGNHDSYDPELLASRYGPTWKSWEQEGDLILILDPNPGKWRIEGAQLEFLKNELAAHPDAHNIFVFFHQLIWWQEGHILSRVWPNSIEGRADTLNYWTEIEPLFHALRLPVYLFAGDCGAFAKGQSYMYYEYDNLHYIASGMGGGVRDNFLIIEVDAEKKVKTNLIALNSDDINALGKLEDYTLPE